MKYVLKHKPTGKYYQGSFNNQQYRYDNGKNDISVNFVGLNNLSTDLKDARIIDNLNTAKTNLTKLRKSICNTPQERDDWCIMMIDYIEVGEILG